jgi:GTP-binding protein
MSTDAPTVAIVGRPNVGKSTLFNRLVGRRRSITLDTPGVTRDPITAEVEWDGRPLRVVDTGGLGGETEIALADRVHDHTLHSVGHADLIVAVFDARAGVNPLDRETVELLQRTGVPILYVANKCDGPRQEEAVADFCSLGIDPPLAVSAEHGAGIGELRERILAALPAASDASAAGEDEHLECEEGGEDEGDRESAPCRIAIVGRPNVGKSSLLNAVAGKQLSLVDASPGTTRDVVDTAIERADRRYVLLDTAGMRRPSRVSEGIERLSVGRSVDAIRRCDVALLLVEPEEGMTDQEARIAQVVLKEGRALVVALNKSDLLTRQSTREELRERLLGRYPTLGVAEVEAISARTGQGIDKLFRAIDRAFRAHAIRVQTPALNRVVQSILEQREPPVLGRGRLRLFYAAQTGSRPPAFTFFVNREAVPTEYQRFIEGNLRAAFPLRGTPIRLRFRRRPSHGPLRE